MNALLGFRFAMRRLRKDAGSTIASIVALACSIGVAVATWSLLSAVLLKPLSIETARLFLVDQPPPPAASPLWVPTESYPVFQAFRESGVFEAIAGAGRQEMLVAEVGEVPQSRQVYFAASDFFALGIGCRTRPYVHGRGGPARRASRGGAIRSLLAKGVQRRSQRIGPLDSRRCCRSPSVCC